MTEPLLPARLETERLRLRPPALADAAALFHAYACDPQVAHYMTWPPHTEIAQTEAFLQSLLAAMGAGTQFAYLLELKAEPGRPVGVLDARRLNAHTLDCGYALARPCWGQGLMPEAVRGLTETALATAAVFRVQATCDVDNTASARTLEKAGFVREGRLERLTLHPNLSAEPRACFMYARCR